MVKCKLCQLTPAQLVATEQEFPRFDKEAWLDVSNNPFFQFSVNSLKLSCPYQVLGCNEEIIVSSYNKHIAECNHRVLRCSTCALVLATCDGEEQVADACKNWSQMLLVHETDQCPERQLECCWCKQVGKARVIELHSTKEGGSRSCSAIREVLRCLDHPEVAHRLKFLWDNYVSPAASMQDPQANPSITLSRVENSGTTCQLSSSNTASNINESREAAHTAPVTSETNSIADNIETCIDINSNSQSDANQNNFLDTIMSMPTTPSIIIVKPAVTALNTSNQITAEDVEIFGVVSRKLVVCDVNRLLNPEQYIIVRTTGSLSCRTFYLPNGDRSVTVYNKEAFHKKPGPFHFPSWDACQVTAKSFTCLKFPGFAQIVRERIIDLLVEEYKIQYPQRFQKDRQLTVSMTHKALRQLLSKALPRYYSGQPSSAQLPLVTATQADNLSGNEDTTRSSAILVEQKDTATLDNIVSDAGNTTQCLVSKVSSSQSIRNLSQPTMSHQEAADFQTKKRKINLNDDLIEVDLSCATTVQTYNEANAQKRRKLKPTNKPIDRALVGKIRSKCCQVLNQTYHTPVRDKILDASVLQVQKFLFEHLSVEEQAVWHHYCVTAPHEFDKEFSLVVANSPYCYLGGVFRLKMPTTARNNNNNNNNIHKRAQPSVVYTKKGTYTYTRVI
jgi:hypothetical protein